MRWPTISEYRLARYLPEPSLRWKRLRVSGRVANRYPIATRHFSEPLALQNRGVSDRSSPIRLPLASGAATTLSDRYLWYGRVRQLNRRHLNHWLIASIAIAGVGMPDMPTGSILRCIYENTNMVLLSLRNNNFKTFVRRNPLPVKACASVRSGFMGRKVRVRGARHGPKVRLYGERSGSMGNPEPIL
jgi:hypothetical protein